MKRKNYSRNQVSFLYVVWPGQSELTGFRALQPTDVLDEPEFSHQGLPFVIHSRTENQDMFYRVQILLTPRSWSLKKNK